MLFCHQHRVAWQHTRLREHRTRFAGVLWIFGWMSFCLINYLQELPSASMTMGELLLVFVGVLLCETTVELLLFCPHQKADVREVDC